MHIELLDDYQFSWPVSSAPLPAFAADDIDLWFWHWARSRMASEDGAFRKDGLFLINAHGRFTTGAYRQDLQGVELLKHIRLTPWLGSVGTWHAIVYAFESLDNILSRKPGDLILKSPGVTFLRLPCALDLRDALTKAYPEKAWAALTLDEILADLALNHKAVPSDRSFRPFVASDYSPPDSAHQLSNWWGIYEMFLAFSGVDLLNEKPASPSCAIALPDAEQLRLADKRKQPDAYKQQVETLAQWVNAKEPELLILDLRLLGSRETSEDPNEASGMDLARAVRSSNRYVPILLFTASNKAETLLISQSLDIDDYWMKPGMGEHRGLGSREADLIALTHKLTILLGEDYAWLQRAGHQVEAIRQSLKKHWWERTIKWPGPSERYSAQLDIQVPGHSVREEVLQYVESILYTARMIFRMRNTPNPSLRQHAAGSPAYVLPNSVSERLCAALFNQIGQVVELVHDVSEKAGDPFGGKTGNARMGGYFDPDLRVFVFRRCDWWAFYLFAWRNNFSHPGAIAHFQDLKRAVSDLIAWLTCVRVQKRLLTEALRDVIAARMLGSPPRADGRAFPVLRLLKNEQEGSISVGTQRISCENPGGLHAQDARFREQLAMRPEFGSLVEHSDRLLSGS